MLRHAFRFVDSVEFRVGPDNLRSQRAMEKIGGVRLPGLQRARGHDAVVFRINKSDAHLPD
jgi:RimJ/RimL family protein N-acetyltransferase